MLVRHLAYDRTPLLTNLSTDHISNDHLVLFQTQSLLLSLNQLQRWANLMAARLASDPLIIFNLLRDDLN